jgi:hypothetical protein
MGEVEADYFVVVEAKKAEAQAKWLDHAHGGNQSRRKKFRFS